jgi:hypothetical protein
MHRHLVVVINCHRIQVWVSRCSTCQLANLVATSSKLSSLRHRKRLRLLRQKENNPPYSSNLQHPIKPYDAQETGSCATNHDTHQVENPLQTINKPNVIYPVPR